MKIIIIVIVIMIIIISLLSACHYYMLFDYYIIIIRITIIIIVIIFIRHNILLLLSHPYAIHLMLIMLVYLESLYQFLFFISNCIIFLQGIRNRLSVTISYSDCHSNFLRSFVLR